jgi:ribosome-interacting GTPase 1
MLTLNRWPRHRRIKQHHSIWVGVNHKSSSQETYFFSTGQLKAKLAKLKRELLTPATSGGGGGAGFDVARTGVASV